jgi:hypothetical protein
MTEQVHASLQILLGRIGSSRVLCRTAKRSQPAYLRGISLHSSTGRAPWIAGLVQNPTRTVRETLPSAVPENARKTA